MTSSLIAVSAAAAMTVAGTASANPRPVFGHKNASPQALLARVAAPRADMTGSTTIAVRGKNDKLYALSGSEKHFRSLGGSLRATPAVGYSSTTKQTYYVARGSDDSLYVRTDTQPFAKLAPSKCTYQPTVFVRGSTFIFACIGRSDHALYYGRATLAGSALPKVKTMFYQGGRAIYGPTVGIDQGIPQFAIVNTRDRRVHSNVVVRSAADPRGKFYDADEYCAQQVDIQVDPSEAHRDYFGCLNGSVKENDGTPGSLYLETGKGGITGGTIAGRVGIAPIPDASAAAVYVTSPGGVVYIALATQSSLTAFVKVGGSVKPGVSATTVS